MGDYSRYEKQFVALMGALERMDKRYFDEDGDLQGRKGTILHLIRDLRQFAVGQFYFFFYGFSGQEGYIKLNPSVSEIDPRVPIPPEHVLASIIDQIAADITIIQLAAEQYRLVSGDDAKSQKDALKVDCTEFDLLTVGNWLGNQAFWSDPKKDSVEDWGLKTVLTYLTDSVKVRVVPYAQVMLLGIPYSCKKDLRKLLAIPHEMGHFLFWYSHKQERKDLSMINKEWENIKQNDLSLNVREVFYKFSAQPEKPSWSEEIFADVFSVLVGGPLAILTAMDIALEHTTDDFQDLDSDDTHPTPLIRPVLMIKALAALARETAEKPFKRINSGLTPPVQDVAKELLVMWNGKLQERKVTIPQDLMHLAWDLNLLPDKYSAEKIVDTAVKALRHVYLELDGRQGKEWGWSNGAWENAQALQDNAENMLCTLLQDWFLQPDPFEEECLMKMLSNDDFQPIDRSPDLWRKWALEDKRYFEMPVAEMYAGEFESAMDPRNRPGQSWLPVFAAGGWDTHGPGGDPGHPYDLKKT